MWDMRFKFAALSGLDIVLCSPRVAPSRDRFDKWYLNIFSNTLLPGGGGWLKFLDELGQGSFGSVLKVEYKGEVYAMKSSCICVRGSDEQNTYDQAVKHESDKLETIRSDRTTHIGKDSIVVWYASFCLKDRPAFLMEACQGSIYSIYFAVGRPFLQREFSKYAIQLFRGLSYLEMRNFVHRDITKRNLLVDMQGNLKLADFGVSRDSCTTLAPYRSPEETMHKCLDELGGRRFPEMSLVLKSSSPFSRTTLAHKSDVWAGLVSLLECATTGKPSVLFPGGSSQSVLSALLRSLNKSSMRAIAEQDSVGDEDDKVIELRFSDEFMDRFNKWDGLDTFIRSSLVIEPGSRPGPDQLLKMDFFRVSRF